MNDAIAGGATATVTLQPVPPKTVPPRSYPSGSTILGTTLSLTEVPTRIWIEGLVTGWAPDILRTFQIRVDATDEDGDGGGYYGEQADCMGLPVIGAGDLAPAMRDCGCCQGNLTMHCQSDADCGANGPCGNSHEHSHESCREQFAGLAEPCGFGEPSRCLAWDGASPGNYFPAGWWYAPGFIDKCDSQSIGSGIAATLAFDLTTLNYRWGGNIEPGEIAPDFAPSYTGTMVLEVPADAKGTYHIDLIEDHTFLWNSNDFPDNNIPIAALNEAVIRIVSCFMDVDCQDNDACTIDVCQEGGCCTNTPVAGWNPDTECCHPMNGVQAPIPPSTPCRIGACSLGGGSGAPTFADVTDGTACTPDDRCFLDGQCSGGACDAEQYAGSDCLKSRFISYEAFTGSTSSAYRVRLVSLHHPDPPYRAGVAADFSAFEGQFRWVGAATTYVESTVNPAPLYAAILQCNPHYGDWSAYDLLHVTGSEIVPSSTFEVQSIAFGLDINVESNYSAPIVVQTNAWGDAVYPYSPPGTTIQPNATDHALVIDKFKNIPGAVSKVRAAMAGPNASDIPNLTIDVDFGQVSANIDAFRGQAYPYAGPVPCP